MTDIQSLLSVQKINISKPNANQLRPMEAQRNRETDMGERRADRQQDARSSQRSERRERADEARAERNDDKRADRDDKTKDTSRADATEDSQRGGDETVKPDQAGTKAVDIPSFETMLDAELPTNPVMELATSDLPIVDAPPLQTPLPGDMIAGPLQLTGQQLVSSTSIAALAATTQTPAATTDATAGIATLPGLAEAATAQTQALGQTGAATLNTKAAPAGATVNSTATVGGIDFTAIDGDLTFTQRAPLDNAAGRAVPAWAGQTNAEGATIAIPTAVPSLGAVASVMTAAIQAQAQAQAAAAPTPDMAIDPAADGDPTQQNTTQAGADANTARANSAAMAARDPVLAHRAMNQAGMEIARAVQGGKNHFEIKLDPPELGRIEVRMTMDKEKAQARLMVERPETLDMLMRDKTQLERILSASGLDLEGGIDMQLMDQGDGQSAGFDKMMADGGSQQSEDAARQPVSTGADELDLEDLSADVVASISEAARNPLALNRIA
ncbi:MAG: flagellar hook-length control protein FliK [Pseudomonadota bacterium]